MLDLSTSVEVSLEASSVNSGKRRVDSKNEVRVGAIPVRDALEDFDLVGAAFEFAGVYRIPAVTEDAAEMALPPSSKLAERRNTDAECATSPGLPEP